MKTGGTTVFYSMFDFVIFLLLFQFSQSMPSTVCKYGKCNQIRQVADCTYTWITYGLSGKT